MKLLFRFALILTGCGLAIIILSRTGARDLFNQVLFDLTNRNHPVLETEQASLLLNGLVQKEYSELPADYLKSTEFDLPVHKRQVENKVFYSVGRKDLYRKIAGYARIKDFLPNDQYLRNMIHGENCPIYWLVDSTLLFKIIELQGSLILSKYNHNAFRVISAYRYPAYNERIEGASYSKHISGGAVDILIMDVNNDRKYTRKDKEIIYDLLDREVIGQEGGLGRYPGKRTLHFDVRGKLARWDR